MFEAAPADFELGRTGLLEITSPETIGDPLGSIDEGEGTVSVYFEAKMPGYPGWRWTASIAHIEGGEPTVLETELTPGEGALLSPDWVPWADRLAEYKEAQLSGHPDGSGDTDSDGSGDGSDDDDSDEDDDDDDDDDLDEHDALLHSGDLDGVDIDSLEDEDEDEDDTQGSAFAVGIEEADNAEADTDEASPEPPPVIRRKSRGKKEQGTEAD